MTDIEYRIEHDTMGEVRVPKDALYAAQTQRAVENFPISGDALDPAQIVALARIKKAAALANKELGTLDGAIADAIARAADRIIAGEYADQFPIDVYQTGSGTSSNMNMNEVLATLATRDLGSPVHPNDHVNASQSSNDVFPTSVHIAVTQELIDDLIPALDHLAVALEAKAEAWKDVVKSGRTHLMDATPVTLGQEFGGYARQMRLGIERVQSVLPRVAEVPLGGTAVGTGINTPLGFPQTVIELIVSDTELPITEAKDHFEAQANRDGLVEASGALRTIAVSLTKINNDIRWMGSGPNTGLGELHIPDLQPGSSIMPGKVNPVVPEATLMVCARVIGNDATIAWAGASGSFELNVAIPVMGTALLESIRLLANTMRLLADKTIDGLEANVERTAAYAGMSPVDRDAAQQAHRLRGGRQDREALRRQRHHRPRGGHRPRLRRPRRADPRAARREARPPVDDPPRLIRRESRTCPSDATNRDVTRHVPPDLGARPHPGRDPRCGVHRPRDRRQRDIPRPARAGHHRGATSASPRRWSGCTPSQATKRTPTDSDGSGAATASEDLDIDDFTSVEEYLRAAVARLVPARNEGAVAIIDGQARYRPATLSGFDISAERAADRSCDRRGRGERRDRHRHGRDRSGLAPLHRDPDHDGRRSADRHLPARDRPRRRARTR